MRACARIPVRVFVYSCVCIHVRAGGGRAGVSCDVIPNILALGTTWQGETPTRGTNDYFGNREIPEYKGCAQLCQEKLTVVRPPPAPATEVPLTGYMLSKDGKDGDGWEGVMSLGGPRNCVNDEDTTYAGQLLATLGKPTCPPMPRSISWRHPLAASFMTCAVSCITVSANRTATRPSWSR